jgi:predicted transcriptional regulator
MLVKIRIWRLTLITLIIAFLLSAGYWLGEAQMVQNPLAASSDVSNRQTAGIDPMESVVKFPTATGSNLQREKLTLPADFGGELNIVLIAFEQWQQNSVNTWLPFVEQLEPRYETVRYYELPVIRRMNFFARTFINEGMRAGIPDTKARERTITLYLDKPTFRQALDVPHERDIHVLIVDRAGNVLWRTEGAFSPEKGEALVKAIVANQGQNDVIDDLNLEEYRWQNRLLLLFAPNSQAESYIEQMRLLAEQPAEIADRDLIIISLFAQEEGRLANRSISVFAAEVAREHYDVAEDSFAILLLGKDGGLKFRADRATSPAELFALIDSMPMRQQEMRERRDK